MNLMIVSKINFAKEAFYAKDYSSSSESLYEIYKQWAAKPQQAKKENLNDVLAIVEQLVELPEIEVTDYIVGILAEERVLLERNTPLPNTSKSIERLKNLCYDLHVVINYFHDYLGGMNESLSPTITVGIESQGKYCFFENIYESQVNNRSQELK